MASRHTSDQRDQIDENASKTTDTRPGMNELEERIYKRTVKMLFNAARDPDSGAGDAA